MRTFEMTLSVDGRLHRRTVSAADLDIAVEVVRNQNPGCTVCLLGWKEA